MIYYSTGINLWELAIVFSHEYIFIDDIAVNKNIELSFMSY